MTLFDHPLVPAGSAEAASDETGRMLQMITGYWVTQITRTAAEFRIADHMHPDGATPEEIADAEALDQQATYRFLRACASLGLVRSDDGRRFTATPLLETLRADSPNSLRAMALWGGSASHWGPWGNLAEAVRSGGPQAEATLGAPFFDWLTGRPGEARVFTDAMTTMTRRMAEQLADVIDVKDARTVVDVGGAGGNFVHTLLLRNPSLTGVVFDLSHASADAQASAERLGVADRSTFVVGDFFEQIPSADIHLLKFVLHDWDDESSIRILRNCRDALTAGGRILVAEMLVDRVGTPGLPPLMDLNMLTLSTGRERCVAEYEHLFRQAGLVLDKISPSPSLVSVLEVVPV
ncbi:methyltransferase [Streptomyces sp. NPDC017991]|uniref:methyltransferase n=1 Tax=Streptomyces sp. NPDC017991 TaxID=3365026 RepID=UPI0037BA510C